MHQTKPSCIKISMEGLAGDFERYMIYTNQLENK